MKGPSRMDPRVIGHTTAATLALGLAVPGSRFPGPPRVRVTLACLSESAGGGGLLGPKKAQKNPAHSDTKSNSEPQNATAS